MTGDKRFKNLLEPGYIGKVRTRNRIIKTANGTSFIETSGYVGQRALAYYETMARGGVGLLIVESCGVEFPLGVHHPPVQFHLDDDKYIPSYSELSNVIHRHGCPTFLQLIHSGAWNPTGLLPKRDAKSASTLTRSELPGPDFLEPREATLTEIEGLIDMFASAAERAHKAGFDGVEINGATCTLPNSFFSRIWNRREDDYGHATLENRARFMVRIIQEIKKRLGQDFAVNGLINIAEFGHDKGTTVDEGIAFARLLQEAGADGIQVRVHGYGHRGGLMHPDRLFYPEPPESLHQGLDWSRKGAGAIAPLAETVRKAVSVPVFAAGRFDPKLGEMCLRQGKLDFVGMTRRLLADPELPNKVAEGRLEDINPCTGCLHCMDMRNNNRPIECRVNAALGREGEYAAGPAGKKKRVLVAGGGPAGMEAARVAALRGHEVTLYEKEPKLGGSIPVASVLKDIELDDLTALVRYLKTQITKLGVTVRSGKEINPSVIRKIKPDALIIATGGAPATPEIPGIDSRSVVTGARLHRTLKFFLRFLSPRSLERLSRLWMPIGKRVVIIGGAIHGCEVAEFLVKRGRRVTIVDTTDELGEGITKDDKGKLFKWLDKKGAIMLTGVKYEEITDKALVITNEDGERISLPADSIITALPLQPGPVKGLEGIAPEIYLIGDCKEPRLIPQAIADGWRTGHTV